MGETDCCLWGSSAIAKGAWEPVVATTPTCTSALMKRRAAAPPVSSEDEASTGSDVDQEVEDSEDDEVGVPDDAPVAGSGAGGGPSKKHRTTDARFAAPSIPEAAALRQASAHESVAQATELDRATFVSLEVKCSVVPELMATRVFH